MMSAAGLSSYCSAMWYPASVVWMYGCVEALFRFSFVSVSLSLYDAVACTKRLEIHGLSSSHSSWTLPRTA